LLFEEKKQQQNITILISNKKRTPKAPVLVGETYIAKADANCIKVETQIFLDHPTGKMNIISPLAVLTLAFLSRLQSRINRDGILKISWNASNNIYRWSAVVHNITHMYAKKGVLL